MKRVEKSEKNVFFETATDIETALMTFGGSWSSVSGPSNLEKCTFSKKCQNWKKHDFSCYHYVLALNEGPSLLGILNNFEKKSEGGSGRGTCFFN